MSAESKAFRIASDIMTTAISCADEGLDMTCLIPGSCRMSQGGYIEYSIDLPSIYPADLSDGSDARISTRFDGGHLIVSAEEDGKATVSIPFPMRIASAFRGSAVKMAMKGLEGFQERA